MLTIIRPANPSGAQVRRSLRDASQMAERVNATGALGQERRVNEGGPTFVRDERACLRPRVSVRFDLNLASGGGHSPHGEDRPLTTRG